jgi:hypothetical protein
MIINLPLNYCNLLINNINTNNKLISLINDKPTIILKSIPIYNLSENYYSNDIIESNILLFIIWLINFYIFINLIHKK